MGTRSTIKFYEDGRFILALYKQCDGTPESWGADIKKFLKSRPFVNGINGERAQFNGLSCACLQLIREFKTGAGDLYATFEADEQSYNYVIEYVTKEDKYSSGFPHKLIFKCLEDESYDEVVRFKWKR